MTMTNPNEKPIPDELVQVQFVFPLSETPDIGTFMKNFRDFLGNTKQARWEIRIVGKADNGELVNPTALSGP